MQGVVQKQRQYQPGTVTVLWLCIFFHIMCECGLLVPMSHADTYWHWRATGG